VNKWYSDAAGLRRKVGRRSQDVFECVRPGVDGHESSFSGENLKHMEYSSRIFTTNGEFV
jgi:hypothetical protein